MNGWTESNNKLHEPMVTDGDPDIICLMETHLKPSQEIELEGYLYEGLTRKLTKKSQKGSGGIAILTRNKLMNEYKLEKVCEWKDNILGIKYTSKEDCGNFVIYCMYAPPEGSKYSMNNDELFNVLTIETYKHNDNDKILVCGDFNARTGGKNDTAN